MQPASSRRAAWDPRSRPPFASWRAEASAPSLPMSRKRCRRCAANPERISWPAMLDRVPPRVVTAGLAGPVAARALREGAAGTVAAVFERSFYLSLGGMFVCMGPHALGAGPLNVLYD